MRFRLAALSVGVALAAAQSAAAATLTSPGSGATGTLSPFFSWTMGANEVLPAVWATRTPGYKTDDAICSAGDPDNRMTSCPSGWAWDAGTWYLFVQTQDADTQQIYNSPLVRIVVPARAGFGFTNPWGGNPAAIVQTESARGVPAAIGNRVYLSPFSTIQTSGWLNDPGAKITVTYTVRRGRRVVSRVSNVEHAGGEEDWSFQNDLFLLLHVRGVPTGTRLRCTIVLKGDGATASKTVAIRNPPSGGRRVK